MNPILKRIIDLNSNICLYTDEITELENLEKFIERALLDSEILSNMVAKGYVLTRKSKLEYLEKFRLVTREKLKQIGDKAIKFRL